MKWQSHLRPGRAVPISPVLWPLPGGSGCLPVATGCRISEASCPGTEKRAQRRLSAAHGTQKSASPSAFSPQFDFTFVEVYRVKRFQFTSKHVEDEDSDLTERGKQRFGQICTDSPSCCCPANSSSWNCDGEVLHIPSIEVR